MNNDNKGLEMEMAKKNCNKKNRDECGECGSKRLNNKGVCMGCQLNKDLVENGEG